MKISLPRKFFLDVFFPKFCFGCNREGNYLCQDCQSLLDISANHQKFKTKELDDLYFALEYKKPLVKRLIQSFKYEPFAKELSTSLSSLIINHFQLLDNPPKFLIENSNYIFLPVPLSKGKLKWRGFNQAAEIAKELSKFLKIPNISDVLIKQKETLPQVELDGKERKENIKGVFSCQNKEKIYGKKILLVDDVYTTGATMEECAGILKFSGAKEVTGIVIAIANPKEDSLKNL